MKAGKQPRPERYPGIPHVISSSDQKSPGEEAPANVSGPKDPRGQRADRLAGNQQGASPPQTCAGKDHRHIAQVQKIGPAPKSNVSGQPHQRPQQPNPPQHRDRVGSSGRRPLTSPTTPHSHALLPADNV